MTRIFSACIVVVAACLNLGVACGPNVSLLPSTPVLKQPPGSTFSTAAVLQLDANGEATVSGAISGNKVDVYDLGPCEPGDRIRVTIQATPGSPLDPTAGLFNADGKLLFLNDDANLQAGRLESMIDHIIRVATEHCFLATTRSFFATESGGYGGVVAVERGGIVPTPSVQILLLDFRGGRITIPNVGTRTLPPFDAHDIDPAYDGTTDEIKSGIKASVLENFQGTGLRVMTTDEAARPPPGTFTTLYFGSFSQRAFGISEDVDHDNMNICDDGIIFTDNFSDPFARRPSVDGIAVAIGNVASHEAGHLLGLEHVAEVTALMDTTGTASTLLADQEFKVAPLDQSVFPIGEQDAPALLNKVIPP